MTGSGHGSAAFEVLHDARDKAFEGQGTVAEEDGGRNVGKRTESAAKFEDIARSSRTVLCSKISTHDTGNCTQSMAISRSPLLHCAISPSPEN